MKQNKAKKDEVSPIVYVGWALVVLSGVGFTYLIVSTVKNRKQTEPARAAKQSSKGKQSSTHYRSNDDYDDDFNNSGKKRSKPKNGKRYK